MPKNKRRMTMSGWIKQRWDDDDRISWDELWLNTAVLVSRRSKCSRDKVGAVIVSADNVMLSVGYNGAPAGLPVDGPCRNWCPRAIAGACGSQLQSDYSDCYALHAETNAMLKMQTRPAKDAVLYVTSTMCWQCAMNVANSGVTRVVMSLEPSARDRNPERVIQSLSEMGVEVAVWQEGVSKYRAIFMKEHGLGPHNCYFCSVSMPWVEVIHHINGDHDDNAIDNLAAAHTACHTRHHHTFQSSGTLFTEANPRHSVTTKWERRKQLVKCATCGLETVPGWLRRHCKDTGHSDGGILAELEKKQNELRAVRKKYVSTCLGCSREFAHQGALAFHHKASDVCKSADAALRDNSQFPDSQQLNFI